MLITLAESKLLTGNPLFFLGIGIICVVLSIVFYLGKGNSLIAGYNSSSKEEKDKYDERKLNILMGTGILIVGICCIVIFCLIKYLPEWTIWIFVGLILLDAVLMCVFANTLCKKDITAKIE